AGEQSVCQPFRASHRREVSSRCILRNTEQSLLVKAVIYHAVGVSSMELSVYVDGKFYPQSEAKVSVFDHGLLYGEGVFEGIRAYNGRVFKLDRHLDRLYHSAKAIDLKIPHTKE